MQFLKFWTTMNLGYRLQYLAEAAMKATGKETLKIKMANTRFAFSKQFCQKTCGKCKKTLTWFNVW